MSDHPHRLSRFWQELKRRKVIRVITVYAAAAYVIIELTSIVAPSLGLPDWTLNFVIILMCAGFVIAVILSWIFDVTPEGIEKTAPATEVHKGEISTASKGWRIATYASMIVIIGLIILNIAGASKRSKDIGKLDKTIAVIPFEVWNTDEEFRYYLGDAIANEINTQLAKIHDFHVFSFTSSSQFKGENKPSIPEIGQLIGANFIVEGTVERQNEDVSIHAQVILANTDDHIWADEFRGKWEDIFTIRADIAVKITEELKIVLSPEELKQIEKNPASSTEAYNMVLLGNYLVSLNSQESLKEALNSFQYAIRLDSTYAEAYVGMAQCYQFMIRYSFIDREEGSPKALEAVDKALELDPSNGRAYATLGLIKIAGYWDIYGPESDFQKAIRLSPNDAWVYASYAQYLRWLGDYEQAMEIAQQAAELDPLNPLTNMWRTQLHILLGQYDKAINYLLEMQEEFPDFYYVYSYLAYSDIFVEDYSKAVQYADIALSYEEYENVMNLAPLAWTYAKAGNIQMANEILAKMNELCEREEGPCDPISFATVYTGLGDYDQVFQYLAEALETQSGMVPYLRASADFLLKEISSDPRFNEILKQIGYKTE